MQVTVSNLTQGELVTATKVKEAVLAALVTMERIPGIRIDREWAAFSFTLCRNGHPEEIKVIVVLETRLQTDELDPEIKECACNEIRNGLCPILVGRRAEEINVVIRTPDSALDGYCCS